MMSVVFRHTAILFSTVLLLSNAANAEQTRLEEIVVVASKTEQSLGSVSSSTAFLNRDDLAAINHTHINEAMQRIAGVWISRGNGQEHLTAIRSPVLTGAGSCGAFLMAQDSVSLRAAGFCNVNELFEAASELSERIEVIKGPGSSIYGSNALHGVVNIITSDPQASLRRIKMEAGPDDYYRATLSASTSSLRADFSGTTDGGYKDDSGFDQQKLVVKHVIADTDRTVKTTFSYTNLNQETAGFIQGHEAYKDSGARRDNPNPEAYRDARSYRLVSEINRPFRGGNLQLRPYLRSVDMEFLQHFLPGQAIEENGHDSIGLQTLWSDDSSGWLIGLDLEYTKGFLEEFQPEPTMGSPFLMETIPQGQHYDYEVDASMAGFFTQYQTDVAENLSLTLGFRYEFMQYDYDNKMISGRTRDDGTPCGFGGCRFNRPEDRTDTFNNLSPKLGLIYQLAEQHQIYSQLSRGFRAPQATELYRLQGGQSVSDIDPVELDSIELGFRGTAGNFDYDVSLFAMEKDNFIFRDTSRRNVDNGETTHRGIELSLNWSILENLSTSLAFTYAKHEYDNNPALSSTLVKGNDIDTAPETLGSATLSYQPTLEAELELEWVHIGEYYEDPQNQHKYEGHDLLHIRARWQMTESSAIFCRIMNLTDEDYAERADFGFGNDRYFVGTPRSFYLGVDMNF